MLQRMMLASRIHAKMELLAIKIIKGFGAFAVLITMERRAHVSVICIRYTCSMYIQCGLTTLRDQETKRRPNRSV